MQNTQEKFSILLLGNSMESVRFEVKVLRSLGFASVRGIIDIEEYCKNPLQYSSDIILVNEVCGTYYGIDIIKRISATPDTVIPIILLLSEEPTHSVRSQLDALHVVYLVRPYTYNDIITRYQYSTGMTYPKQDTPLPYYKTGDKNSELIGIIYLQLFVKTVQIDNAVNIFMELKDIIALKRLIAIVRRSAYESQEPQNTMELFCQKLEEKDKELAAYTIATLFSSLEHNTLKNVITRKIHTVQNTNCERDNSDILLQQ